MMQLYKFRPKLFLSGILTALLFFTLTWKTTARSINDLHFRSLLTTNLDTTKPPNKKDTALFQPLTNKDTTKLPQTDTGRIQPKTDTFSLKISKDSLAAPIKYAAEDSAVVLVTEKKVLLFGKTKTEYQDISLTAPQVEVDQATQVVTAVNKKDSSGVITEEARFKSGESEFTSDTIRYNFKTQIGLTKNTYTSQGEFIVFGEVAKKVDSATTFIKRARFSTCNLDHPHFSIVTPKMKVINQKLAVSGPAHLEFEDVPIPIYLPFGFYPLSQGRHSGLLPPQFSVSEQFGLGLEGLGYYKVLSEYWDAKVYGNIYSYGGWSVNFNPTYRKRYRYSGAFNLGILNNKQNFKGDPDYRKSNNFSIFWNHSVDGKARPGTTFSANVQAQSTKYNEFVTNNAQQNFQNLLGSSIAYSKSWAGKPYNLTLSANHNQNNALRLISMSLPDAGFTVSTLYPFERKNGAGTPKWYEKLGVGYNGNFRNQFSFYDTAFSFKRLIDTLQWGAQHNFPITLSLPPILGGAVIVSPSISYSNVWIAQKFRRKWNTATQKADTTITKGFYTDHQLGFSLGLSTAIFGTYQFKKSRIIALRHVIRPQISINYRPDLSKSHYFTDTISPGLAYRFSEYSGALYPGYAEGRTGGISFGIDNNLEMKWRSKKDTGENAVKKIRLIDGYGFNSSYNFLQDSMKLYPFSLYIRSTLFEKISITAQGILTPYQVNEKGVDIDRFTWQDGKFNIGRLSTASISVSTSFKSKPRDAAKEEQRKKEAEARLDDPNLIADQQQLLNYMQQNPSEFVDFNVPWSITLGYSLFFSNRFDPYLARFDKDLSSNVNFNGSFSLTPKWNFTMSGYYDFDTRKLQTFQMSINREMHCWQMSINVTPIGLYRSFNFTISPKASVLQDLKINRTRFFSNY